MKIDKIQINNFRAFYGENIFQIDGKNCLIYGENGSGKSSFYMALKMFIESSAKDTSKNFNYSIKDIINKYSKEKYVENQEELDDTILLKNIFSYLDVDIKNPEVTENISFFIRNKGILEKISSENLSYAEINDIFTHQEQIEIVEDYLENAEPEEDGSYLVPIDVKNELIRTHLTNWNSSIEEDLLNYFIGSEESEKHFIKIFINSKEILIGDTTNKIPILKNCASIKPFLNYKKLIRFYSSNKVKVKNDLSEVLKEILKNYVTSSGETLKKLGFPSDILLNILNVDLLKLINKILKIFHMDLEINSFEGIADKNSKHYRIYIKTMYNGKEIPDFHLFLNEARLSALSMAVYFASIIRMYEIADGKALKILVLDDILVGLDMGNRLNLIQVLEEYFSDFQIFMLTYDKAWYETFKNYRRDKNQWVDYELYKQKIKVEDREFEVPVKIEFDNSNYMERAEERFDKFDYPACANYLRKETEKLLVKNLGIKNLEGIIELSELKNRYTDLIEQLKNLNLDNILSDFNDDLGTPNAQTGKLFGKLKSLKTLEAKIRELLDKEDFLELNQIKDTILNPLSHHDIESPIYKEELTKAIEIVKRLKK